MEDNTPNEDGRDADRDEFPSRSELLTFNEYRLLVIQHVSLGHSFSEIEASAKEMQQHTVLRETLRDFYIKTLSEVVTKNILDNIFELCCNRNEEFLSCAKNYASSTLDDKCWKDLSNSVIKPECRANLEKQQLTQLLNVLGHDDREKKRILATVLRQLKVLVMHFSSRKAEEQLIHSIVSWFRSGEMAYAHYQVWCYKFYLKDFQLKDLRDVEWPSTIDEDPFLNRFHSALEEVPTEKISSKSLTQLKCFVDKEGIFAYFTIIEESSTKRLKCVSRTTVFLQDRKKRLQELLQSNKGITDVILYAKNAIVVDCSLENEIWHGLNLTLASEKIVIKEHCTINLSGLGFNRKVRGKAKNGEGRGPGEQGSDGRAGESSGNFLMCADFVKNPKRLKVILNGGDGEGGQDGGDGVDGHHGTESEEKDLIHVTVPRGSLSYLPLLTATGLMSGFIAVPILMSFIESAARTEIKPVLDDSGSRWTEVFRKEESSPGGAWSRLEYKCEDGRSMEVDCGSYFYWFTTKIGLRIVIRGEKGTMGTEGGSNGVGGEGGNSGEFKARRISSGERITGISVEMNKGHDGYDGNCGEPGNPGSNGGDIALIVNNDNKYKYGLGEKQKISYTYDYDPKDCTAYSGFRYYSQKMPDCYVGISTSKVDKINVTRNATIRKASDRQRRSQAVSKQNISVSAVLEEYIMFSQDVEADSNIVCEEADFDVPDEETEESSKGEEQIRLVRQHVQEQQLYGENRRRIVTDAKEVQLRVQEAVENGKTVTELISLWNDIFSVPFDVSGTRLKQLICLAEQLENSIFDQSVKEKLEEKARLSQCSKIPCKSCRTKPTLELKDGELHDVCSIPLNDFWKEVDSKGFRKEALDNFFSQLNYRFASVDLLSALFEVYSFLTKYDKVFKPYEEKSLDWCNTDEARAHLRGFLGEEERKKLAEIDTLEEQAMTEAKESNQDQSTSKWKLLKDTAEQAMTDAKESNQDQSTSKWKQLKETAKNLANSVLNTKKSFEEVTALLNENGSELKKAFASLTHLMKDDARLCARISIESKYGQISLPGSTSMSLIHLYFFSQQILHFNMQLCRYHQKHVRNTLLPLDWWNGVDDTITSYAEFISFIQAEGMPMEHDKLQEFMLNNGIKSGAYRQFIADVKNVNVQVFCDCGYLRMRLAENINPFSDEVHRLHIDPKGNVFCIGTDYTLYNLQQHIECKHLNIALPTTEDEIDLSPYFSEKEIVEEWTRALNAVVGPTFPKFLQKLFGLRGCEFSTKQFQFMVNTFIHSICNFDLNPEALISFILSKDGVLEDVWLALRLTTSMEEPTPKFGELIEDLKIIKNSNLKCLFGAKAHDVKFNQATLKSLVEMLTHAENRIDQLEKLPLSDWIDIAKCQDWSSHAPLLEKYGDLGYYFVILNSVKPGAGDKLRSILDFLTERSTIRIVFEKILSRITYMVSYGELELNDETLKNIRTLFETANKVASFDLLEDNVKFTCSDQCGGPKMQKFGKVYFVVSECFQQKGMRQLMKKPEWKRVFPDGDRKLSDVIRLTTSPQDDKNSNNARKAALREIRKVLESDAANDSLLEWLIKIDDVIFEKRQFHLRHTQKVAILSAVKNEKNLLSQVNTGEGKSLIIAALAIMRIKIGSDNETVDIITSSSVLAERDAENMRDIYESFGLTVSHNCNEDVDKRKDAYKCNVVYGDISHFQRDYLLHNFYKRNILGSRMRCNVIVDEVDCMLLDNGSNTLYLSHNIPGLEHLESLFMFIHKQISMPELGDEESFSSQVIRKKVMMDMCGYITKDDLTAFLESNEHSGIVWRLLLKNGIIYEDGVMRKYKKENMESLTKELKKCEVIAERVLTMITMLENRTREITVPDYLKEFALAHLNAFIDSAKTAMFLTHNDEYVVDLDHTGRSSDVQPLVTIIDKGTGTDLSSSQWSEGLHQFLQLKHGCRLSPFSLKAVFISNVSYLKGYAKLNGFSGTLGSEEESKSLVSMYNADLVRIPTWKAKAFNENSPIVAVTRQDWIRKIYQSVCNQIMARRSVLIICRSIIDVDAVHDGLCHNYEAECERTKGVIGEAFANIVKYTREYDDFSMSRDLSCKKIIISTNLAGRGTDITLAEELAEAGGLHVIITFLPENIRIEEQAYGRVARCGQPGSGQIIALMEDNESTNIFQLKQFRDNAEVHRLRSLKVHYDYHIDVEETCLRRFRDHCSSALASVYSYSEDKMPSSIQIIYFALLDQWAMWLDGKNAAIKKCEENKSNTEKAEIIHSFEQFLEKHALMENISAVDHQWISCPQPILALALLQLHEDHLESAEKTLQQILNKFPEFSAEAYYYMGVLKQKQLTRSGEKDMDQKERLVLEATTYFLNARGVLTFRAQQKNMMSKTVCRLQQNPFLLKSRGFVLQQEEAISVLESLIGNIDDILGHTVTPEDVRLSTDEPPFMHLRRYREYVRAGIFSPTTLMKNFTSGQLRMIANNHSISIPTLRSALNAINESEDVDEDNGLKVVTSALLNEAFSIPSAVGFWQSLRRCGCFDREAMYIAVKKGESHLVPVVSGPKVKLEKSPFLIQLWGVDTEECDFYPLKDCARLIMGDNSKNQTLEECVETGAAYIESVAQINPSVLLSTERLDEFDYLTVPIVMSELSLPFSEAHWILQRFVDHNVLTLKEVDLRKQKSEESLFDTDCDDSLGEDDNTVLTEDQDDDSPTKTQKSSKESCDYFVEKDRENESNNSSIKQMFDSTNRKVKKEFIYLLSGKMDCSMFPENVRPMLEDLLTKHFSYGYAMQSLRSSIKEALTSKEAVHRILLPLNPYSDLHADLQSCGLVSHGRVARILQDVYHSEDKTFLEKTFHEEDKTFLEEEIYNHLSTKAPRMFINGCQLLPTTSYLLSKSVLPGEEARKIIGGGLREVAVIVKPYSWKWLLGLFVSFVNLAIMIKQVLNPSMTLMIGLVVLAAVGTALFILSLMRTTRKLHVKDPKIDEFKIIRDFHEAAIKEKEEVAEEAHLTKKARQKSNQFVKDAVEKVRFGCIVTKCDEGVRVPESLIKKCCESSEYLPLLRSDLRRWFTVISYDLQKVLYSFLINEELVELEVMEPPKFLFAFASLLVADINASVRQTHTEEGVKVKRVISTNLNYQEYMEIQNHGAVQLSNKRVLCTILRDALLDVIEPIVDECVREIMQPAINRIEQVKRERKISKTGTIKMEKEQIARKKTIYIEEKRRKTDNTDYLAKDLHKILLQICFRDARPEILRHMVHYNYPLSTHCATIVFEGVTKILMNLNVRKFQVHLKRNEQNAFSFTATSSAVGGDAAEIFIALHENCFYIHGKGKEEYSLKYRPGVFEALSDGVQQFSERFAWGAEKFTEELEEAMGIHDDVSKSWTTQVQWYPNEKLRYPL